MNKTIQEVIDIVRQATAVEAPADTVDTFKSGDPSRPVTGIVTTFMATIPVIRQAAGLNANLIITHEPTFFNHRDETAWIEEDAVYRAKRHLLDQHGIAVWRFHDTWHMTSPDGILTGIKHALGWEKYASAQHDYLFILPPTTVAGLAGFLKEKLDLGAVRLVGNPAMPCSKVGFLMGSVPGEWQVDALRDPEVDVIICGETVEWQTCEYVRDSNAAGIPKAMLAIGHEKSEEAGMAYLVEWLKPRLPGIPIQHVPAGDPLQVI